MLIRYTHRLTITTILLPLILAETSKPNTGDQPQGFSFFYPSSPAANSVVIPITPSCPSPLIVSGLTTTNNAKSSDPVAPYTLVMLIHEQLMDGAGLRYERMYARSMDIGNMAGPRSIPNVLSNGTQFIGCVWSSNGVSGGCQDLFTVSASDLTAAAYANATSQCRDPAVMGSWVTPASSTLDVSVEHSAGILASNGWPASCSDLRITPKNGTAPYTLLIAPAFHPPVNITSSTRASMNYTVKLTHGQAFMLGVFDSAGNSFAFGPLHAGRADDVRCLAVATGQDAPASGAGGLGTGAFAGGVLAAFLIGAVGAALVLWGFVIRKQKTRDHRDTHNLLLDESISRPYTYRTHSDQSYSNPKPLDPYQDSPLKQGGAVFESPDTLYDPHVGGSGTKSTDGGVSRPPGGSFAVTSRSDFGPSMHRAGSRDDPNMPIETPSRSSKYSDPRHHSFPSSSSGLTQHRFSSDVDQKRPPPGLRLVGTPVHDAASAHPWDDGSDGEEIAGLYRQPRSRDAVPATKGRRPRPSSSHEEHDGSLRPRNVYVVHSDGGGGDVHIQLPEADARVIELPPGYRDESGGRVGGTGAQARPRSGSNLSPESRPATFGPRAPRPTSANSQNSVISRTTGVIGQHRPASISQTSLSSARPTVLRTKSELERAEAAYLHLDSAAEGDQYFPSSPPIPSVAGSPPGSGMRTSESMLSVSGRVMSPEEIRARAEAALAEKSGGRGT